MEAVEGSRKRKRGAYEQYSDEVRTKIARYAIDNGVAKTSRRFTADLGKRVSETTVRSMREAYVNLKKSIGSEPTLLTRSPRGAPTILGRYDEMVQQFIRRTRANGGVVNIRTVTAAAEGILKKFAKHRLRQFGAPVVIDKSLARSILRRMGFVKRKGTKATKTLPSDFAAIQQGYVSKVEKFVRDHAIPDSLVLNFDQTGCHMVPGGEWTMEERGTDQITIAGLDDKRQMTVLLTATRMADCCPATHIRREDGTLSAEGRRVSGWMGHRVYRVPLEHRGLHDALREGGPDPLRQQHPGIAPSLPVRSAGPGPV